NLTLNTFLGGRQKSWMVGHHPNVSALAPTIANREGGIPTTAAATVSVRDAAVGPLVSNVARSTKQQPRSFQNGTYVSPLVTEFPFPGSVDRSLECNPVSSTISPTVLDVYTERMPQKAGSVDRRITVLPSPVPSNEPNARPASEVGMDGEVSRAAALAGIQG